MRLYAEDPRTFLPQSGRLERLRLPTRIRVDAGVAEGDEVGTRYDPLIAKLIAHGPTRDEALARLRTPSTRPRSRASRPTSRSCAGSCRTPRSRAGDTTTAFLVDYPPLSEPPLRLPEGPWRGPFRLNLPAPPPAPPPDIDEAAQHGGTGGEGGAVAAPMPGTVIRVLVAPGDRVEARQPLVVLEAMKMETPVVAPYDGTVAAVHVEEGDAVAGGTLLVELEG